MAAKSRQARLWHSVAESGGKALQGPFPCKYGPTPEEPNKTFRATAAESPRNADSTPPRTNSNRSAENHGAPSRTGSTRAARTNRSEGGTEKEPRAGLDRRGQPGRTGARAAPRRGRATGRDPITSGRSVFTSGVSYVFRFVFTYVFTKQGKGSPRPCRASAAPAGSGLARA